MKSIDFVELYNCEYFLGSVDGFREFNEFDGSYNSMFYRFKRNIELIGLKEKDELLEIGCGRGEICLYHSLRGGAATGIDFSRDAITLATNKATLLKAPAVFIEAPFQELHFEEGRFDCILASEFIEHISKEEGKVFFEKAYRWLKPSGKLLVFTYPNQLQRKIGYKICRFIYAVKGKKLPKRPPDTINEHYKYYHLNEQTVFSLKKSALSAGFRDIIVDYDMEERFSFDFPIKKIFRHLFLTNIFLIAKK